MREMVFNDASINSRATSILQVAPLLADLARGMALLIKVGLAGATLRLRRPLYDAQCAHDGSLFDAIQSLRAQNQDRDAMLFLLRLSQKVPLLVDLPLEVASRFAGSDALAPRAPEGDCLVLCAHIAGIAVSVPLERAWDVDQLQIRFLEIQPNADLLEAVETVDNLARVAHAPLIIERERLSNQSQLTPQSFWSSRATIFPRLQFGLDLQEGIRRIEQNVFTSLVRRIDELHASALDWDNTGGPAPIWRCRVTPESESAMRNPDLRRARIFRDSSGTSRLYEWHARFGSAGRIHLRFDGATKLVEIGYVGGHLPLS